MGSLLTQTKIGMAIFTEDGKLVDNELKLPDYLEKLSKLEAIGLTPERVEGFVKRVGNIVQLYEKLDMEKFKEILRASEEDRLFISPLKVGDMLWPICWDGVTGEWYADDQPERVNEVGTKGFFLSASIDEPEDIDEFYPYEMIGDEYFLSHEEAVAAAAVKGKPEVQE